jgi:hypothetical protein
LSRPASETKLRERPLIAGGRLLQRKAIERRKMATERIRTEEPVKNTIHNLVQTLSVKLDSAARYGIYQEDAKKDGFDDCAELFAKMAETEQRDIQGLVRCLKEHIGDSGARE